MYRWFRKQTKAQIAGRQAGIAWKKILYHTYSDLEELFGKDAYTHACEEAARWIACYRRAHDPAITGLISLDVANEHEMFLEYVEGFLKEFEPELRSKGQPKE